jgi:hypothetical protein
MGTLAMTFPQGGGCQCGSIRYEISGPPTVVYACHCTECQRQSGAAFAMAAVIPQERFSITKGEPKLFARRTSLVKTMECWFCPDCGTRLYHVPGGAAYPNRNIKRHAGRHLVAHAYHSFLDAQRAEMGAYPRRRDEVRNAAGYLSLGRARITVAR